MNMEFVVEMMPYFSLVLMFTMACMIVVLLVKIVKLKNDMVDKFNTICAKFDSVNHSIYCIDHTLNDVNETLKTVHNILDMVSEEKDVSIDMVEESGDDKVAAGDDKDELDIHLITPSEYYFSGYYSSHDLIYDVKTKQVLYYTPKYNKRIIVDNVHELIGDGLMFFGINSSDPNVVYVRNHKICAEFRIERVGFEGVNNND